MIRERLILEAAPRYDMVNGEFFTARAVAALTSSAPPTGETVPLPDGRRQLVPCRASVRVFVTPKHGRLLAAMKSRATGPATERARDSLQCPSCASERLSTHRTRCLLHRRPTAHYREVAFSRARLAAPPARPEQDTAVLARLLRPQRALAELVAARGRAGLLNSHENRLTADWAGPQKDRVSLNSVQVRADRRAERPFRHLARLLTSQRLSAAEALFFSGDIHPGGDVAFPEGLMHVSVPSSPSGVPRSAPDDGRL